MPPERGASAAAGRDPANVGGLAMPVAAGGGDAPARPPLVALGPEPYVPPTAAPPRLAPTGAAPRVAQSASPAAGAPQSLAVPPLASPRAADAASAPPEAGLGAAAAIGSTPAPAVAAAPAESVPASVAPGALADRIEWLAARGGGTARVRLDPPSLGEVELEVRLRGQSIELTLRTHGEGAHALLSAERGAIGQILASRELRLESFVVTTGGGETPTGVGSEGGASAGGREPGGEPPGRGPAPAPPAAGTGPLASPLRSAAVSRGAGRLDVRV